MTVLSIFKGWPITFRSHCTRHIAHVTESYVHSKFALRISIDWQQRVVVQKTIFRIARYNDTRNLQLHK